jgi:hypothetical protein
MALRSQAAIACIAAGLAYSQELRFDARHDHLKGSCQGTLTFDQSGAAFRGPRHSFAWPYAEIQRLELTARQVRVTTYRDSKWRLGADRSWTFRGNFQEAYAFLKQRLDQRFVAAVADEDVRPVWQAPAKHLTRFGGSHGTLLFGDDRAVYNAGGDSRTWRYEDIEGISSSGPFELTVDGYDRSYRFQLKKPLAEDTYNDLWRRITERRTHEDTGNPDDQRCADAGRR